MCPTISIPIIYQLVFDLQYPPNDNAQYPLAHTTAFLLNLRPFMKKYQAMTIQCVSHFMPFPESTISVFLSSFLHLHLWPFHIPWYELLLFDAPSTQTQPPTWILVFIYHVQFSIALASTLGNTSLVSFCNQLTLKSISAIVFFQFVQLQSETID